MMSKMLKKISVAALVVLSFTFLFSGSSNALSGSEFRAGRIIDDSVFFNSNSMSVAEIQNFLNSKVVCDTNGTKMVGGITRAQYAADRGWPTTFTCLPQYRENITTKVNNIGSPSANPAGSISAAQIIYNASAEHGVSSKALIVLLQKEQSLITDEWPVPRQYQIATGYGCPDTAPCDEQYYGFYNQVNRAAFQFKRYVENPSAYRYKAGQVNSIQWHPDIACGATNVYIENGATAALYNYTPYQPNAAALNNLYGSGDGCSAYGNRNFWRMWRIWFGSVSGEAFSATYKKQSPYQIVNIGNKVEMYFDFENTGTAFWKDETSAFPGYPPVRLATTNVINRSSLFRSNKWSSSNRPTGIFSRVYESDGTTLSSDQHTVFPGQIARFSFEIEVKDGTRAGLHREFFQPILEGSPNWSMGQWVHQDIGVNYPGYSASYHSQSGYPVVARGSETYGFFRMRNSGTEVWYDDSSVWPAKNSIRLATALPVNRNSKFNANWPFSSRPVVQFYKVLESDGVALAPSQNSVRPGQIAEFVFVLRAPVDIPPGVYREDFQVIAEGAPRWSMGPNLWLQVTVQ
jgi:hypothetical protein